jgi:hypothetical protein
MDLKGRNDVVAGSTPSAMQYLNTAVAATSDMGTTSSISVSLSSLFFLLRKKRKKRLGWSLIISFGNK